MAMARGKRRGGRQVEARQDAVAVDVGVDDGGNPGAFEPARQLGRVELARLRPTLDRHLAAPGVDADRDAAGKAPAGLAHQRRVAHRHGAQDHAGDALGQPRLDGGESADAAAELHRAWRRLQNGFDRGGVDGPAREGAVEVDDVQVREALGGEQRAPGRPDRR